MKRYDRAYFDRFYRGRERVGDANSLRLQVGMVVSMAEYLLGRAIRTVLDIGCGEGRWRAEIRRLRPVSRYRGVDPSEYVVREYGAGRNIVRGGFDSLAGLHLPGPFDLVVCADVLHYIDARRLDRGLRVLPELIGGVAYLDVTTADDEPWGDLDGWFRRSSAWYRDRFERAGLVHCGMQFWVGPEMLDRLAAMEVVGDDGSGAARRRGR